MKLFSIKNNRICILLIFISCSCLNLIEDPKGLLTNPSFLKTEYGLNVAVTGVYHKLISNTWAGFCSTRMWTPLMGADDLTTGEYASRVEARQFDRFCPTNLNTELKIVHWNNPYAIVYAANNVLENYERVDGREVVKKRAAAQACFLRAFAYFWMTRLFGDLPLVTFTTPTITIELSPVKDIYGLIVSDLQFAKDNLPDSWPGEPGRVTRWTAQSMLAQVYLTMAGWPLKDEPKYVLAEEEAKDVIDNGPYRLLENFADLWKMSSNNNDEFIWSIQCVGLSGNPQFSTIVGYTTMPREENGWDDVMFENSFYNRFPAGPRKDATFHTKFQEKPGDPIIDFKNSTFKHPFIAKYRDGALDWLPSFEHHYMTSRDVCYLRFAEVLLTYAEAQTMADGTPNSFAYHCVNRIRTRAGLENLSSGLGKISFRDAVVEERAWELAAEYSRWFDLIRTEKVEEIALLKDQHDMLPLGTVNKSKYHAPIPYSEVLLNPNLANSTQY